MKGGMRLGDGELAKGEVVLAEPGAQLAAIEPARTAQRFSKQPARPKEWIDSHE
ncbi:MAG: hypothetical protein R3E09_11250 [Novosphingobium sp.]